MKYVRVGLLFGAVVTSGLGQTFNNFTLVGSYTARHVEFTTDGNGNVIDARSLLGTITFDGESNYVFAGQQVIGTGIANPYNSIGTYSVTPAAMVTLSNPQSLALTINARYGVEALIGSSTNASTNTFDLFVAIAVSSNNPFVADSSLNSNYHMVDFELTNASTAQVRVSGMAATFDGAGNIQTFLPLGHVASVNNGATQTSQQFTGIYALSSNRTGDMLFTPVPGTATASNALLTGEPRNLYLSPTGNLFMAANPGGHDILLGVLNAPTDHIGFSGSYWLAALGAQSDFVGSGTVIANAGMYLSTLQANSLSPVAPGLPNTITETESGSYQAISNGFDMGCGCGIGSAGNVIGLANSFVLLGNGGLFVAVTPGEDGNGNPHPGNFTIEFGEPIPPPTGAGVWINPQGIVNASTYAPVGDNISPGEFIQIYGNFLAVSNVSATMLPFPTTLATTTVSINGTLAPLYNVQQGVITCVVPYELTGTSATIVVTSSGAPSNSVTVGAAPFSPGVISANSSGFGDGAITHANNMSVNSASPAVVGETVQMYVTGLGGLTRPVADGSGFTGIDDAISKPLVFINGIQAPITYWGLTADAGLYQIDVTIPPLTPSGEQNVAVVSSVVSSTGTTAELTQTVTVAVH